MTIHTPKAMLKAIRFLPEHTPIADTLAWPKQYRSHKQHWIGWLSEYHTAGHYGRTPDPRRDARYVFTHLQCGPMIIWLAEALDADEELLMRAKMAHELAGENLGTRAAAVRRVISWRVIRPLLFR